MSEQSHRLPLLSRISKNDFHHLKVELQKYQLERYPELVNSLPLHGRSKNKELIKEEVQKNSKNSRRPNNEVTLLKCLEASLAKATSSEEFTKLVKDTGHGVYFRSDKLQGVKFQGETKYRFSRLGFDVQKILALDQIKTKEERELAELSALRSGKARTLGKDRTATSKEKDGLTTLEKTQLQELADLRSDRSVENSRDDSIDEDRHSGREHEQNAPDDDEEDDQDATTSSEEDDNDDEE